MRLDFILSNVAIADNGKPSAAVVSAVASGLRKVIINSNVVASDKTLLVSILAMNSLARRRRAAGEYSVVARVQTDDVSKLSGLAAAIRNAGDITVRFASLVVNSTAVGGIAVALVPSSPHLTQTRVHTLAQSLSHTQVGCRLQSAIKDVAATTTDDGVKKALASASSSSPSVMERTVVTGAPTTTSGAAIPTSGIETETGAPSATTDDSSMTYIIVGAVAGVVVLAIVIAVVVVVRGRKKGGTDLNPTYETGVLADYTNAREYVVVGSNYVYRLHTKCMPFCPHHAIH